MASIVRAALDRAGADPWADVARQVRAWAAAQSIALRDAIVLVPFVQLLAPARRAFALESGWMPRVETTRTLAEALGPPPARGSGELGWGVAHDTLLAQQMLTRQRWVGDWPRRDPRGFADVAARVVATGHSLLSRAAELRPEARETWWSSARASLRDAAGAGGKERLLAGLALEWAAQSNATANDRLFGLRPAGWATVVAGGAEPLLEALVDGGSAPALRIDTDVDPEHPFDAMAELVAPAFRRCDGFEDEAMGAAAQALLHVDRGETPVALISQDRAL